VKSQTVLDHSERATSCAVARTSARAAPLGTATVWATRFHVAAPTDVTGPSTCPILRPAALNQSTPMRTVPPDPLILESTANVHCCPAVTVRCGSRMLGFAAVVAIR
jgi:hypothetical protein